MKSHLLVCFAVLTGLAPLAPAAAADYPDSSIRLIIPAAPGGGADFLARTVGAKLTQSMGQTIVADNRPGASGIIAVELTTKAPADGYTLLMAQSTSVVIAPHMYKKVRYNTMRDLAPITLVALVPNILVVNPKVPANSVKELIALMKAHPGTFNYGSAGYGAPSDLAGAMFNHMAGVKMTSVPYKGAGPAVAALLVGDVQVMFAPLVAVMPMIKSHQLKALAVTSATRSAAAPDLPTVSEAALPGFDISSWFGLFAPAATPPAVINKLYLETAKALQTDDIKKQFALQGAKPIGNTPKEFASFVRTEDVKYEKLVKDTGAQMQ
jgi:tripartite-type tricarboxylate transporter receptor subunit TctC